MKEIDQKQLKQLYKAIVLLENEEECEKFLADLCTVKEQLDMAQRLDTAILLNSGENYNNISEKIGTSAATISRVSRCLNYGEGGYELIIDKLKKTEENNDN